MQVVRASVLVSTDQGEIASPVLQTPQISSHIWPDWVTKVISMNDTCILVNNRVANLNSLSDIAVYLLPAFFCHLQNVTSEVWRKSIFPARIKERI